MNVKHLQTFWKEPSKLRVKEDVRSFVGNHEKFEPNSGCNGSKC